MTGAELRAERSRLRLTKRAMADVLNVTPWTVARWERQQRVPRTIAFALRWVKHKMLCSCGCTEGVTSSGGGVKP